MQRAVFLTDDGALGELQASKTMTSSGRSSTYEASRSEEASHADIAWATMHALLNEPLSAGSGMHSSSILDIN